MVETKPYGTWDSPITPEALSKLVPEQGGPGAYNGVSTHENSEKIYAVGLQSSSDRPTRSCLIEFADGKPGRDVLPDDYQVRSSVYDSSGGSFAVLPNGNLVFTDAVKRGVYIVDPCTSTVEPVLEGNAEVDMRYADFNPCFSNSRYISAIQEDRRDPKNVIHTLVVLDASEKTAHIVVHGADFYSHPRFSPDGTMISWIEWNNPQLTWRESTLKVAGWSTSTPASISEVSVIAGYQKSNSSAQSIAQARWSPDGYLTFASDASGFWQLYRIMPKSGASVPEHIPVAGMEDADFAAPEFVLGYCTYAFLSSRKLVVTYTKTAYTGLILIDLPESNSPSSKILEDVPLVDIRFGALCKVSERSFAVIGSTTTSPKGVYRVELDDQACASLRLLSSPPKAISNLPAEIYSPPEAISFPRLNSDAWEAEPGKSHAIFHRPYNPGFSAPNNTLPPLIIALHGGPTNHISYGLSLDTQFWTTRGYAVAHVNYSGSSGYGRAYREDLYGHWGVRDAADVVDCVKYLVKEGLVDGSRVAVRGGSAGGFTTLRVLCDHPHMWAGGFSYLGIGDLAALFRDTRKFQKWYMPAVVFGAQAQTLSEAEKAVILRARSPFFQASQIKAPLLLIAGAKDHVVPPQQSEAVAQAVQQNGKEAHVIVFEGEGHGFRQGASLKKMLEEEEKWWLKCLAHS